MLGLPNIFGRSPFYALQQHMTTVYQCAQLLTPFFQAVIAKDWLLATDIQQQISTLERQADQYKFRLRQRLPKNVFLPVSRSDVLELLSVQDHIANRAKDIAGRVTGRKMGIPEVIITQFKHYLDSAIAAVRQANNVVGELDNLFEAGFSGTEVTIITDMIKALDHIEHQSDTMQVEIRDTLFTVEEQLPPIDVVFLYNIIEWVGLLADHAEKVGDRLQIFLAR